MKILLTGNTGFIGRRLLERFSQSDEIYVLTRTLSTLNLPNVQPIVGDLNSPGDIFESLLSIRPEACIHLAWQGIPDYGYCQSQQNLAQSTTLLNHLVEKCGCRKIIATGSCWEYNKTFGPCRESDPLTYGTNYFVWAKQSLCNFGRVLANKNDISFIWTRLFYVYGPGQRAGSLIPTISAALINGTSPDIQTPSNANDFIYVDDVADALLRFLYTNVETGIYNVGTGSATPVWKICEMIEHSLGRKLSCASNLKKIDKPATANFWADISKTTSVLKWQAGTGLEEGIQKYLKQQE